jgi:hypothetical protein
MRAWCGSVVIYSTGGKPLAGKEKRERCWFGKKVQNGNNNNNISYNK